jgi:hypothetical protein
MFLVRVSYVELYKNTFRNLLDWSLVEGSDEHMAGGGLPDKAGSKRQHGPTTGQPTGQPTRDHGATAAFGTGPGHRGTGDAVGHSFEKSEKKSGASGGGVDERSGRLDAEGSFRAARADGKIEVRRRESASKIAGDGLN